MELVVMSGHFRFSTKVGQDFVGKVAMVGQRACGKTDTLHQTLTDKTGVTLYSSDDQYDGYLGAKPYPFDFSGLGRLIINDEACQPSPEHMRALLSRQGEVYNGLVLVADAVNWTFKNIAVYHAQVLADHIESDLAPVVVFVNNKNLWLKLTSPGFLDSLSEVLVEAITNLDPSSNHVYFRRQDQSERFIKVPTEGRKIPFTTLEQVLVNHLELWSRKEPTQVLESDYIRVFVRALLVGLYEDKRQKTMGTQESPLDGVLDEQLLLRLNYFSPTTLESGLTWSAVTKGLKLASKEPLFDPSFFNTSRVKRIIEERVLASESSIETFFDTIRSLGQMSKWDVVGTAFSDSSDVEGRDTFFILMRALAQEVKKRRKYSSLSPLDDLHITEF